MSQEQCIYFCGNSLGLQPKAAKSYLGAHLDTWASLGVNGHFTELEDSPLTEWQSMAEMTAKQSARLVGALPDEVAIMGSLTMNLHLLMASFYNPTPMRHKIILEWKAFPSDHVSSPIFREYYCGVLIEYSICSNHRFDGMDMTPRNL